MHLTITWHQSVDRKANNSWGCHSCFFCHFHLNFRCISILFFWYLDEFKYLNWKLNSTLFAAISIEMRQDKRKLSSVGNVRFWKLENRQSLLTINDMKNSSVSLTILNEMNSTPRDLATSRSRLQSVKYDILPKTTIFIFLAIRNELLPNYTKQLVQ